MPEKPPSHRGLIARHLLLPLLLGGLIYALFRDPATALLDPVRWIGLSDALAELQEALLPLRAALPAWVLYNLPDLLWAYTACWGLALLWRRTRPRGGELAMLSALSLALLFEFGQAAALVPGTFDQLDLLAYAMGTALAYWRWRHHCATVVTPAPAEPDTPALWPRKLAIGTLLLALAGVNVATSYVKPTHRPVYLSWSEFREAVRVEKPRGIGERGKIIVVGTLLLMSEPNKGVHLFDNHDPRAPKALAFLRIPGNIDIAVKEGHLYADSFVDLLVFRLAEQRGKIALVKRLRNVFPYDTRQTLPRKQRIWPDTVNKKLGVVIDWTPIVFRKGGK